MPQDVSLWSPVVIACLHPPGTSRRECRYDLDERYIMIDDIRVKIRNAGAAMQGKYVEAAIQLEAIVLVEDKDRNTGIINRTINIRERIDGPARDGEMRDKRLARFILQIEDLQWDAEIVGNEIVIRYAVSFKVYAVRDQVVRIPVQDGSEQGVPANHRAQETLAIDVIRDENEALHRRLTCYQRDMQSLQHGIRKAEERNARLSRELDGSREKVQQLQETLNRRDLIISRHNQKPIIRETVAAEHQREEPESRLGQRIRRLLLNCL